MNSFRRRKRGKWVIGFVLLLTAVRAASVFAEPPPPEGPIQVTVPSPSDSAELEKLPSNAEMAETLARFRAEDEAKQQQLESPAAVQEREVSADSYAGVGAAEAEGLRAPEVFHPPGT